VRDDAGKIDMNWETQLPSGACCRQLAQVPTGATALAAGIVAWSSVPARSSRAVTGPPLGWNDVSPKTGKQETGKQARSMQYHQTRKRVTQQRDGAAGMTVRCQVASSAAVTAGAESETSREAGFTLLEILVVLTIIGLLIGLVAPAALRQLSGARVSVAKQSVERLSTILDLYDLDMGSYPTTEQGLAALAKRPAGAENWNGPYLKGDSVPLDPWNRPYVYRSPSERAQHDYDLCSSGPNGEQSQAAMICNP
jgi:general secretion pathway protein G